MGTATHAQNLAERGWLPHREFPLALNGFWTALTFVDPLVIALLAVSPRRGLALAQLVLVVDVVVNAAVVAWGAASPGAPTITWYALPSQVAFAAFVFATAPWVRGLADPPGGPVERKSDRAARAAGRG